MLKNKLLIMALFFMVISTVPLLSDEDLPKPVTPPIISAEII